MNQSDRKKIGVITKYAIETFSESDWFSLGQVTANLKVITDHPRLLRSMSFGDDDYGYCAAEVIDQILSKDENLISEVVDYFDIDLWYMGKNPDKHKRIFELSPIRKADFWKDGYIKAFISHLSSNRAKISTLKSGLAEWGISAFVAHEDIAVTREWRDEVEAGLESMEIMIAVVEPGFKESDWCAQEIGYALGRRIDIVPLRAGLDPFGFFGKYQGIQIKGKPPKIVANEVVQALLKKPSLREKLLQSMCLALKTLPSQNKIEQINSLDSWSIATDTQIRVVIEQISLSEYEKKSLKSIIDRVGAFKATSMKIAKDTFEDLPF